MGLHTATAIDPTVHLVTIEQAALMLRRAPKTIANMLYHHRFHPRIIEPIGQTRRRMLTPEDVQRLRSLLRPCRVK